MSNPTNAIAGPSPATAGIHPLGDRPTVGGLLRALDAVLSAALLVFLAPLLVAVAAVIYLQDGGPPLFWQTRIGQGGRRFRCYKFRSMRVDAERVLQEILASDPVKRQEWDRDHKLKSDPRITGMGKFLRQSSIDELPQLWNVLVGEMSLVGPRPIVEAETRLYGRYFPVYCSVRPGLTGLWQVSGRNDLAYRRRVAMDVAFARALDLRLYLWILTATIPAVLSRRGSY